MASQDLNNTLLLWRGFLMALGTRMSVYHENRIPREEAVLLVSNHRSFMDPVVLTVAVDRPIRFACHHYMGQVPLLREVVRGLGCFPLEEGQHRQQHFFKQATELLMAREMVGIFPEGASPMVEFTQPNTMGKFYKGFAHLALRSQVKELAILPVAIASTKEEQISSRIPLKLLSFFDPDEPLFDRPGWHPVTIYQQTNILIGRPYWIKNSHRQQYQGRQAKQVVTRIADYVTNEIGSLLEKGCF
jgi:1-acyl-sn-glycerol-3-phosphate acyltransferase